MDGYWRRYLEWYANQPFYWFQPKGFTISRKNLPLIRNKLRLLDRFSGQRWDRVQSRYTDALRKSGLYQPTKARRGSRDYAAIARMNKTVFDSLGLAWTTDDSIIEITDFGHQYLRATSRQLPDLVSAQLLKYLYPNPSVGRPNPAAGVFPYLAFLGVLTHFPQGIAPECYELFVSRIAREQDVAQVVEHIRRYLRLTPDQRQELVGALSRIPIISEGQIVMHARRSSLLRTIGLNRSYMLSFLTTPGLVQESGESLRLKPDAFAEAEAMVRQHLRHNCYIAFASAEDWVAFYGAPQRHPTYAEALAYYRTRGDVARGVQTFRQAQAGGHLPPDLSDLSETGFRKLQVLEKTLEDFLEFNLDVIEKGLIFVARQYRTSTGPLDILARDAAKRWVIIELKRGRAADRVVGQLLRYRGFIVRERGGGNPRAVRCLAIAPDPDARLVEAAIGADPAVEVFEFTVTGRAKRLFPKA